MSLMIEKADNGYVVHISDCEIRRPANNGHVYIPTYDTVVTRVVFETLEGLYECVDDWADQLEVEE